MAISSVNPSISSLTSTSSSDNAISALTQEAKKTQDKQVSTVVSLSSQGQQLNRADTQTQATNNVPNPPAENREAPASETAEKPGIQFMEGESKGGRVNTYA